MGTSWARRHDPISAQGSCLPPHHVEDPLKGRLDFGVEEEFALLESASENGVLDEYIAPLGENGAFIGQYHGQSLLHQQSRRYKIRCWNTSGHDVHIIEVDDSRIAGLGVCELGLQCSLSLFVDSNTASCVDA